MGITKMIIWPEMIFPPVNLWIMPMTDAHSPCKNECLHDTRYGFCISCGRTLNEIARWTNYSIAMKTHIVRKAEERLLQIKRDR